MLCAPESDAFSALAEPQRQVILEFLSVSSRSAENPSEVIEIILASLALKYAFGQSRRVT